MVFSFTALGSVLMYRFTRAATKDKTIHNSYPMTPKQRKNNGYSLVNRYPAFDVSPRDLYDFSEVFAVDAVGIQISREHYSIL